MVPFGMVHVSRHRAKEQKEQQHTAVNIAGDPVVPKEKFVVVGIRFEHGIQRNCHLQHMTLRQAKHNGVHGQSSFTMEDVIVEHCGFAGVVAEGTEVVGRLWRVWSGCRMGWIHHIDRCQDDGAPQLYRWKES